MSTVLSQPSASATKPTRLVLLDGMAITYRAFYALSSSNRVNSKGMNTGAVLGFTMTMYDLIKKLRPTHMAVAFDLRKPTPLIFPSSPARALRRTMSSAPLPTGLSSRASMRW